MSEGYIGYHLENAFLNEFKIEKIDKQVASIITQVEVDKNDEAFSNPTKPIGAFYTKDEALKMNYTMKEDALRGYRRVVASPKPVKVIEEPVIKSLVENGFIVIAVGGGGIPVINDDGIYKGVDAVIDKDYASAKLADDLDADILLILTAVDNVMLNFKKENEVILKEVSVDEMIEYNNLNHFYAGSMKPKVEAAISFVSKKQSRITIITSIDKAVDSINYKAGTIITNK